MMLMICLTGDQDHRVVSIVTEAQESVVEMGISNKTFRDIPCYLGSFERGALVSLWPVWLRLHL